MHGAEAAEAEWLENVQCKWASHKDRIANTDVPVPTQKSSTCGRSFCAHIPLIEHLQTHQNHQTTQSWSHGPLGQWGTNIIGIYMCGSQSYTLMLWHTNSFNHLVYQPFLFMWKVCGINMPMIVYRSRLLSFFKLVFCSARCISVLDTVLSLLS